MLRKLKHALALLALMIGMSLLAHAPAADEAGFVAVFNGKDLSGWKALLTNKDADVAKTFAANDGVLVISGQPNGYIYTDKSYKNYVLSFEWRFPKAPEGTKSAYNSGILIHIQPPHIVWPKSVEVQGQNANHGYTFGIGPKDNRAKFQGNLDKSAQKEAIKPVGEWNTTEITCKDGNISVKINGKPVDSGSGELTEGPFGFQSEGAVLHLRNIKVKNL